VIYKGISIVDLLFYLLCDLFEIHKYKHFLYIACENKSISLCADEHFKQFKTNMKDFKNNLIECINEYEYDKLLIINFNNFDETHEIVYGDTLCNISLNLENENKIDQLITLYKIKEYL